MTALGRQLRCGSDPAEDHDAIITASMCRQSATVCLIKSPSRQHRAIAGLPSRLATLPDPRDRRGRRHPFVSVLLVACSAVTAGAASFTAIGQWARNAPQDTLAPARHPDRVRLPGTRRAEHSDDPQDHHPGLPRRPRRPAGMRPGRG
ncbi:transposase family protein [Streptomyces sp. MS06]|uniref:transposase family protein n=1 Tax=Streptomyces sp. MS06 TaxID=3385974 RepID=UPI0039A29055